MKTSSIPSSPHQKTSLLSHKEAHQQGRKLLKALMEIRAGKNITKPMTLKEAQEHLRTIAAA